MSPVVLSISESVRYGWETLKRNLGLSLAISAATLVVTFTLRGLAQATHDFAAFGLGLLAQVAQVYAALVWTRFAFALHDGRSPPARELLPDGTTFLGYLAAYALFSLLVTAGFILLVVPGIYLAVRYGFVTFLVADGRADVIGAFRRSSELTSGARWKLFLLGLVLLGVNLLGAMVLGIGLLFTVPISVFAMTFVYRRLLAAHIAQARVVVGPPSPLPV